MKKLISELQIDKLYRTLDLADGLDFSSNDYLGLSKSSYMKEKLINFIRNEKFIWRSSSRLISGTTALHLKAEAQLAKFLKRPKSLIFKSGYCANLGVIATIGRDSIIFSDEKNHASIIDGIKLSKSEVCIYKHADIADLLNKIKEYEHDSRPKVIISESMYSMSGEIVDLDWLKNVASKFNATLVIDEAHSTGIFGSVGQGLTESISCYEKLITIHTGGKALGVSGAFIGCSDIHKKILVNKARSFIYTTALSPLNTYLLKEAIDFVIQASQLREGLIQNISFFREQLKLKQRKSPIIPLYFNGNLNALKASEFFINKGIHVKAIRYPTVQRGEECLRVSIHADHSKEDLLKFVNTYKKYKLKEAMECNSTL